MAWWRAGRGGEGQEPVPPEGAGPDQPEPEDDEPTADGWDAIDAAFRAVYGEQSPRHVGYSPGRAFGSVLQGCSAYRADDHWHYVTYGLSNLFDDDEGANDGFSGWGYELTWRVRESRADAEPPSWPFAVIQQVAKAASDGGILLAEGSRLAVGGPVTGHPHTGGPDTPLTGLLLTTDPELGEIDTVNGRVRFLQLVPVDAATMALAQETSPAAVIERMRQEDALTVTVVGA
ncbi:suppressor of fused domain protein [Cellulomonas sp.]|uniref:suppressor of fused domain protein n=1 Tax=Cellulomonas sp. TaxID=40001 RepID=UPI00258FA334|nr:suppressor of fused domain protein [Cellulomonas sp.]MCR6688094.1 suppressor of fused domain protein [Cellulomonas sp.]